MNRPGHPWLSNRLQKDGEYPLLESARTYTRHTRGRDRNQSECRGQKQSKRTAPRSSHSSLRFHTCLWAEKPETKLDGVRFQRGWGFGFAFSIAGLVVVPSWKSLRIYIDISNSLMCIRPCIDDRWTLFSNNQELCLPPVFCNVSFVNGRRNFSPVMHIRNIPYTWNSNGVQSSRHSKLWALFSSSLD